MEPLPTFAADNISTPISFNAYVSDEVALREGDEAADRIISGAELVDHLKLGRSLMVGSRIAAKEAGGRTDTKAYRTAFSLWLDQHPKQRAVNKPNRAAALWCLNEQNWPRVEKYLATLDADERQTTTLRTVRRRLDIPTRPAAAAAKPAATHAASPSPKPEPVQPAAPKASAAPERVQKIADLAEVATLRKEVSRLRDRLDQLAMFLVEKPPPKAEDRALKTERAWPLPDSLQGWTKDAALQRQIVNPPIDDPAFALRREEFEQWLVRRKEALEMRHAAREVDLAKSFEAKVKAQVEARMAKEDANGRVFTKKQFMAIVHVLHSDRQEALTAKERDAAFDLFWKARNRLMYVVDRKGKKKPFTPPVTPDPAPEPPQDEEPTAKALS